MIVPKYAVLTGFIAVSVTASAQSGATPQLSKMGEPSAGKDSVVYRRYDAIPKFIRLRLDSIEGHKFRMADPGEKWNAGCISTGKPSHLLISASKVGNRFQMTYWQGGRARTMRTFEAEIQDARVVRIRRE